MVVNEACLLISPLPAFISGYLSIFFLLCVCRTVQAVKIFVLVNMACSCNFNLVKIKNFPIVIAVV